jgi:hypothetical protein
MKIARPSHCQGCSEWKKECGEVCEKRSADDIIYGVECGICGNKRKTCWKAILPDGWTFNRREWSPSPNPNGKVEENALLCSDCVSKYYDILFDEVGYAMLERTSW